LSDNPSKWESRQNKKYNNIYCVQKGLAHDIRYGVPNSDIQIFLQKINNDSSFIGLRNKEGLRKRFLEIEDFMLKYR